MHITVIACMNPCIESLMTSEFLPMIVSYLGSFDNSPEISLVGLVCTNYQHLDNYVVFFLSKLSQ